MPIVRHLHALHMLYATYMPGTYLAYIWHMPCICYMPCICQIYERRSNGKLVDWAPSSLGQIHCSPDFALHLRCYDAATKRLRRLALCCFQLTIVVWVNCKICPYFPLAHHQREVFGPFSFRCLHFKRCSAPFRAYSASLSLSSRSSAGQKP